MEVGIDGTSSVGENGCFAADELEYANGHNQLLEIISFIEMETARHAHHSPAIQLANNKLARMGFDGGNKEIRNILIIDNDRVFDLFRKSAQCRSQNECNFRLLIDFAENIVGTFLKIIQCKIIFHILYSIGFYK